jgi:hypothetical protein
MRQIKIIVPFDVYTSGQTAEVEDQVACDAIAQGYAVPSIEEIEMQSAAAAPENMALNAAPEAK